GAFITPVAESGSGSEPAGQFVVGPSETSEQELPSNSPVSVSNAKESSASHAIASVFANQCKSAVKNGKYFCVDSEINDGQFFIKGVGTYSKNLETSVYLGTDDTLTHSASSAASESSSSHASFVFCTYPYVTNDIVCDNVGKLVDDYYSQTGGKFIQYDNLPLSASSDASESSSSHASIGFNTLDLCSSEMFNIVDSLKALGVLDNSVCSILSNSLTSSNNDIALQSQNLVTASSYENEKQNSLSKITLVESNLQSSLSNNKITANAVVNNNLARSSSSVADSQNPSSSLENNVHQDLEEQSSSRHASLAFDGSVANNELNKLSLAGNKGDVCTRYYTEAGVAKTQQGICLLSTECDLGYNGCNSGFVCCTNPKASSVAVNTATSSTAGTNTNVNANANSNFNQNPKSDNARMALALLQMFTRQDKVKQAAGAGSGYYYREWKTKPSLKQPDCGSNDPILGSGYPTGSYSSSGSNTLSNTASSVGASNTLTTSGSPGGAVTVGGSPVGGNPIIGAATGLGVARDNVVNGYGTNSYSSSKSSQDKQDSSQNLITGNQVLPVGTGGSGGRPIGTVQKPFVESGPFSGLYHTTEGAVFSFPTTVYLTIYTSNGSVANGCGAGSVPTSSTFNDTRTIATGGSVNTDLGGVTYNVLLVNFTTATSAIVNVTSVDGSSAQTVSLGVSKSILGVTVLMKSVANDTSSAVFFFSRTQTSGGGVTGVCENIPVPTDTNGYFKYFYSPMDNGTYRAVVKVQSNGAGPEDVESGLVLQKQDIFTIRPFVPPTISTNRTEACSSPLASTTFTPSLVDRATFGIIIQNSGNFSLSSATYTFEIIEEPNGQGDAGFEDIDENGNLVLLDRKEVSISAGQIAGVNLSSAMILPAGENSHTYTIRARVSNATYNVSQEFTFNHTVFKKLPPVLEVVSEPIKRPFDLRPETYFIRITNPNPVKCGANNYFLLKEVPNLWSGKIEVDGETDLLTLNAGANAEARFTLTPNPSSTEIGKRYQANLITTEGAPSVIQSLVGANDLIGIDADTQKLYFVGPNRVAIFDKINFTGQSFEANGGRAIVADSGIGGNIYWSEFSQNEGRILCSSKQRFSGTRVVSQADAAKLAITDNYIYYTDKSAIYRAIKNCVAEQTKERVYFTNTSKILDISGDGSTIYWLETAVNGSVDVKSVGESQIGVNGALDVFTIASRDNLGSLYISKGTGGLGLAGASGIYYSTNTTTSRIALLSSTNDRVIIGGASLTSANNIVDLALDNNTVYWIDNGVKRISKDNPVTYVSVFYEYRPDSPLVSISPINISMSSGETRTFNVNVTNKAYLPINYQIKLDNLDSNWTAAFIGKGLSFNETFNPREIRGYTLSLTANSSIAVNTSFSICVRAVNTTIWSSSNNDSGFSRCISILVGVRSQPTLALDIIDARAIENGSAKVLPSDTLWYNLSITNNDGPEYGIGVFNISMSVPNGWNYFIDRNLLNISSLSRSSTKIRIETPANAIDGQYELNINVSNKLDATRTLRSLSPKVIIHMCGNSVCDLEKGEDNTKCPVDCPNPGFTDIGGVYTVPGWPALLQHDFITSTSVNFSTFLSVGLDRSLEQQKILACVAGANMSQCKQAQATGICGFGSSCLATRNISSVESIPVMEMKCPSDRTEAYYLLYTGKKVINLTPTDIDFISPNYTYSCPFYNSTGLRLIKASLEEKTSLCQQILFNYNNSVYAPPAGRTKSDCVSSWTKICSLEGSFLRYVNLVMDPGIISVENSQKAFELYSKLNNEVWFTDYHQCEGVVTLFIEDIRVGP
ncbi:MAG: hypothetical protein HY831_01920, partial [Candidatus Aenigmarchaeota archaeon]|nr:hypothetical protein [Candidatus Aenigmarchaeota archaeon]